MCKARLDDEVTAFEVADITHSLAENLHVHIRRRGRRQIANTHGLHGLLRPRRERPRGCRAAEQGDELAARAHSIASSARSRSASGTFKPSTLAVVRLMTKSNLVGCSTGMSAGFAPRKILSTISAARRSSLAKLGPADITPPASTSSLTPTIAGRRAANVRTMMRTRCTCSIGSLAI